MFELASKKVKREINLLPLKQNGLFSKKNCYVKISNPQQLTEKVFLATNNYLQFDVAIEGDVESNCSRRDQDFNDL
jgi:hypothetical protein